MHLSGKKTLIVETKIVRFGIIAKILIMKNIIKIIFILIKIIDIEIIKTKANFLAN